MSRTVQMEDPSKWDEAEALYLFARGQITEEQLRELGFDPARGVITDPPPAFMVHTGDANTSGVTQKDIDKATQNEGDDSLEPAEKNLTEPQLQGFDPESQVPAQFTKDVVVNEEEEYSDWSSEQLEEELAARGLSTGGSDKQKAARLEKDDAKAAAEEA